MDMITAPQAAAIAASDPLAELMHEATEAIARGEQPQVVFDLDDTLFLVQSRKRAIFRELAGIYDAIPAVAEGLARLAESEIPYDVAEALAKVGIVHDVHVSTLKDAFFARFFDGDYVVHDDVNHGAVGYVAALHERGVRVVYLTGRPHDMHAQTRDALVAEGFPVDERTALFLKRDDESHLGDAEFKGLKAFEIRGAGPILASFDNEPANLNAMLPAMPDARWFLLDTDHSPNPPALAMTAHVVTDFACERLQLAASLAATPRFSAGGWNLQVSVGHTPA